MEFTLLGAVLFAVLPLYGMLYWEARRGNAASCTKNLWDIALAGIIAGVFIGRLAAMIGDGVNPLTHPADIIIVRGGVATGPAALAALATVAWLGRDELWPVLDGLAAAALAGLGGWHAGCVVRDACLGTASDLPWAVAQDGSSVTRHPVEIYAAVALFIGAIVIAVWRQRGRPAPAVPPGLGLAYASLVRLLTEPLRPNLTGGPVAWYVIGVVTGLAVAMWAWRRHRHRRSLGSVPAGD